MIGTTDAMRANRADSLGRRPASAQATATTSGGNRKFEGRANHGKSSRIRLDRLAADPTQPRKTFAPEPLQRLADSMRVRGQLVPILVRWDEGADRYVVIDGERRYRAAQVAKLADMACVVEDEADPSEILELQLVTNALREDVDPIEQAHAWERLIQAKGYSHAELAERLGYDRSTITRTVGLTRLPEPIQQSVASGEIAPQTGYELSRVADPDEQSRLADEARAGTLRRDDLKGAGRAAPGKPRAKGRGLKVKLVTSRTWKGPTGLRIEATRAKGLDMLSLLETMRAAVADLEAEQAPPGDAD